MSYQCPECGKDLERRWPKFTDVAGGMGVGLCILLFAPFFRQYDCPEHGRIQRSQFAAMDRRTILGLSFLWLSGVLVILGGLGWYISTKIS